MAKHKMAYAVSALAISVGVGALSSTNIFATASGDLWACDDPVMDTSQSACVANSLDSLMAGLEWSNIDHIYTQATINVEKDLSIDISGKEIAPTSNTSRFDMFNVSNGATLTITGNGTVIKEGPKGNIFVVDGEGSTLQLNGGTYRTDAAGEAVYGVYLLGGGTAVVNDGVTIDTTGSNGAAISGNNTTGDAHVTINGGTLKSRYPSVYMAGQVDLTVNGGSLEGGIFARMGQIEINGGTITGIRNAGDVDSLAAEYATSGMVWTGDAIAVYGGTYNYAHDTYGNSLNLKIEGGSLSATNGNAVAIYDMGKVAQEINVEINGGILNGGANDAVKTYWIKDTVATPKAGYGEIRNDINIGISGGEFATEPDEGDIIPGHEAEETYDGSGIWKIVPINIEWQGDWLEELYNEDYAAYIDINGSLVADHRAELAVSQKTDLSGFSLTDGGDLLMALDIDMVDRNGTKIVVEGNDLRVYVDLSEEDYNRLATYDKIQVVYLDEDGNEVERLDAELLSDDGWYWIEFTTSHLSTYGIVGVNEEAEEAAAADATTPETGTVTRESGSVMVASLTTAIAVGIITSAVSFVYLMRRR